MAQRRAVTVFLLLVLSAYPALMRSARNRSPQPPKASPKPAKAATPAVVSDRALAQNWMRQLTPRERIAQLIMITSYGEAPSSRSAAYKDFVHSVRDLRVGGMIVVNRVVGGTVRNAEPYAMASFLNRMQRLSKLPLLIGGDFERGASMRVAGTVKYPHQMAYAAAGDLALTRQLGAATAREASALGVHWVFAPVADVNSNPDNPIINIRSFGEDPKSVADHVAAFIEGAHSDPKRRVLVTAKHFPGHGDTSVDSHMGLPKLEAPLERLNALELVPFRAAIKVGVDSIMTAHMAVPAVEPEEIPATVSTHVLTGLLRKELNFSGLIVTDAMDMQGLTKQLPGGEAAVRALEAGADMLLMPTHPEAAIKAVAAAIRDRRISQKRIDESVLRVLMAKARLRLDRRKLIDVEKISDEIESLDLVEHAQTVADKAVTVLKNESDLLPLKRPDTACTLILAESRYGQQGRRTMEEFRARSKSMRVQLLDPQISKLELEQNLGGMQDCQTMVLMAFVSVGAYRGNVALGGNYPELVETLLARDTPVAMVSLGSPYLLRSYPRTSAYMATFSPAPTAEIAAVKALLGEIPVTGKTPVSIPGHAALGDGLNIAKK